MTRAERRREKRLEKKKNISRKREFEKMVIPLVEESVNQHHLTSPDCGLFDLENRPDGCYCSVCGFPIVILGVGWDEL